MQMGAEVGLAPMQALQSIAVINGRPGVWGDGLLALIKASPLFRDMQEFYEVHGARVDALTADDWKDDTTAAVCIFVRDGQASPVVRKFSVGQARRAQLLTKPGPWQQFPDQMLRMRARSFAARDAFPDVLRGIRQAEELHDTPADDPVIVPRVRRLSDAAPPADPAPADLAIEFGPTRVHAVDPRTQLVTLGSGERVRASDGGLRRAGALRRVRRTVAIQLFGAITAIGRLPVDVVGDRGRRGTR